MIIYDFECYFYIDIKVFDYFNVVILVGFVMDMVFYVYEG